MSFLGSLYAAAATPSKPRRKTSTTRARTTKRATFQRVTDIGPYVRGFYVVKDVRGRAVVYRRVAGAHGSLTGFRALDRLFMAAAAPEPVKPQPGKPQAIKRRVKLLTTAKAPLGSRHFQRVAEIGPYVPGFYVVKNVDGKAIVYRRSAIEMRRFPGHLGYPCP